MGKDPKLFRELNEPFESHDEAVQAMQAFVEELNELRKKHRIANVYYIVAVSADTPEGEEGDLTVNGMYGDSIKSVMLTGYAYGYECAMMERAMLDFKLQGKKRAQKD